MSSDAEKAEIIQSVKAFLIPSSLFIATVIMSAGTFLIYNGYTLGWAFVGVSATVITIAFVAFVHFQNKLRAGGKISTGNVELEPSRRQGLASNPEVPAEDKTEVAVR